jgi:hypothetical protein
MKYSILITAKNQMQTSDSQSLPGRTAVRCVKKSTNSEQSPQADFDSPIPSILRGAQQDFGARAESRSDLPICELRI